MRLCITMLLAASAGLAAFPAAAQSLDGAYRGMFVCEKMPASPDILRVPIDLLSKSGAIQFARPIFNFNGQRVLGSELGSGTVDADGTLHLKSSWHFRGVTYEGEYSGTLKAGGGTLTGTQAWSGPKGDRASRTCTAALVLAPQKAAAR